MPSPRRRTRWPAPTGGDAATDRGGVERGEERFEAKPGSPKRLRNCPRIPLRDVRSWSEGAVGTPCGLSTPEPRRPIQRAWSEPEGMRGLEGLLADAGGELGDGEVASPLSIVLRCARCSSSATCRRASRAAILRSPIPARCAHSCASSPGRSSAVGWPRPISLRRFSDVEPEERAQVGESLGGRGFETEQVPEHARQAEASTVRQ